MEISILINILAISTPFLHVFKEKVADNGFHMPKHVACN